MPEDIVLWRGQLLSDLPREELEAEFIKAQHQIRALENKVCKVQQDHINDLAKMRKKF